MPSPARTAAGAPAAAGRGALSTSEQRILELAGKLQASLRDPFDREPSSLLSAQHASSHKATAASQHEGVKLSEVFDELIASDQANRLHQLMQEASFKDRELQRLREMLQRAQQDCSWAQQKHAAAEEALSKVASTTSNLQTELKALHTTHEQQRQQLHSLTSAKAAAEHAASIAESRAAAAEAKLSSKSLELEQVQGQYKRLLDDQQSELERLRQQLQQQSTELSKLQASASQKEHSLLQQLQGFNSGLKEMQASHAADKATAEQLQKQVHQQQAALQEATSARHKAEAAAKQLEGQLADSETERKTLRAKYINLGEQAANTQAYDDAAHMTACWP